MQRHILPNFDETINAAIAANSLRNALGTIRWLGLLVWLLAE